MKKIFLIIGFVLLLVGQGWATTYNIGPGQTYETFTSLEAAVVLAGDDIVDGGGNTFYEQWTPATNGTSGHPITLQNAIIDGENTRGRCILINLRTYYVVKNMILKNSTGNGLYSAKAITLENITVTGSGTKAIELKSIASGDTYVTDCTTSTTSSTSGLQIDSWSGGTLTVSNLNATGSPNGIRITNCTFSSAIISDSYVSYNSGTGIVIENSASVVVDNCEVNYNTGTGISASGTSHDTTISNNTVSYNGVDGIGIQATATDPIIVGNTANYNGQIDSVANGDGITLHEDNTGAVIALNVMVGNRNSGVALIGNSSGVLYNNTMLNNGDSTSVNMGVRGNMYITASGGWTIKQNICQGGYPYEINGDTDAEWAGNTIDNNYYLHTGNGVTEANFSSLDAVRTWAEYHVTDGYETNSVYADPLLVSNGKLLSSSPCIDVGAWIAGVNDGGEQDPWDNYVFRLPNIGADQKYSTGGSQKGKGRTIRIGVHGIGIH